MTDALIDAIRTGNEDAFRTFVQKYEGRVAATVIGMLGPCPEAEDVGQEVFINFYRNVNAFRGESDPGTYLTRIAINLSLNAIKKRKRRWRLFSGQSVDELSDTPYPNASNLDEDDREAVHQAIRNLKPAFQSVVVLRMMDGYSTRETSDILGVPVGTVQSRLSRALTKLKNQLSPDFKGRRDG